MRIFTLVLRFTQRAHSRLAEVRLSAGGHLSFERQTLAAIPNRIIVAICWFVLNKLATGVIFLGANGEVVLMNRRAHELLGTKDGLFSARGKLSAAVRVESDRLQGLIHGAVQTGRGSGLSAGGTILISREKRRPLSVTVAPLRDFNINLSHRPAAVLFISDPDRTPELPADLLQRCYGLTPAEVRLAMVLLEGHSLKEAANSCCVTYNTAKSQLKIIFLKTNVQRPKRG